VQPRRPLAEALADAMDFLKRADDGYVPGSIDGQPPVTSRPRL